ncbi:MAG: chromate transporter [Oscillospiraceae bacterium]|nr:chromate transporter [Oscillospiraceae bacterium]MBQ1768755.1 chromate transporter [Oscillospiraceae bacterium]MBQ2057676.1 chromate transporter [Oscillospiraceae bacterium]MBQ2158468.1 chromate transporter [Oscillospiraceae bacterium]MBQ2231074.1 chromate transporter [Oscillospiraceae bacterium]
MLYLQLYWEFFKTGLFAVGGGLATLPFLYRMADATGWFTRAQLTDMIAVSESTPGPIGVNMATYVGYITGLKDGPVAAVLGAAIATLGLITPSIIIILIIAKFLKAFGGNKTVQGAFYGLRPASTALIASAGLGVAAIVFLNPAFSETKAFADLLDWKSVALAAVLIVLTRFLKPTKKLHPIVFIALSAVVGIVFRFAGA